MQNESIEIRQGTLKEAYQLYLEIPEFQIPYSIELFRKRLEAENLILLATFD